MFITPSLIFRVIFIMCNSIFPHLTGETRRGKDDFKLSHIIHSNRTFYVFLNVCSGSFTAISKIKTKTTRIHYNSKFLTKDVFYARAELFVGL